MKIGVPKEIKDHEQRVALTPAGVVELVADGHDVLIEKGAGLGSGFSDQQYQVAAAKLVTAEQAWQVDLVLKVKEPQTVEYPFLQGQMVFTFFHLAGVDKSLTETLLNTKTTALAYELLEDKQGRLPILEPMSAIAGNMSVLMGAYYLAQFNQGNGVQLGSVLGYSQGKVLIIGDGVVGCHAAKVASAMGAHVTLVGLDKTKWQSHNQPLSHSVTFVLSTPHAIAEHICSADLVIGAVLCRGSRTPKIITRDMVTTMPAGSVIVDVSIDQGGCLETSRPTTHSSPVFIEHDVIHYCVTNMPGAFPKTATIALTHATIDYIKILAKQGIEKFINLPYSGRSVCTYRGQMI